MSLYYLWRLYAWLAQRKDLIVPRFIGGKYYGRGYTPE